MLKTGFFEIFQISERLKQSVVNAFYVCPLFPTHNPRHELCLTLPGVSYLAISAEELVFLWNYGQRTESPTANLIKIV